MKTRSCYVTASNITGELITGHVHAFKLDATRELAWLKREGRCSRFTEVMTEDEATALRAAHKRGEMVLAYIPANP